MFLNYFFLLTWKVFIQQHQKQAHVRFSKNWYSEKFYKVLEQYPNLRTFIYVYVHVLGDIFLSNVKWLYGHSHIINYVLLYLRVLIGQHIFSS